MEAEAMEPEAPNAAELFDRLARFGAARRGGLSVLDGAAPDDPVVGRSFENLTSDFEALGDLTALRRDVPSEFAGRLESELSELARLNAVLVGVVGRDKERLLELLKRSQDAQRACRDLRAADETGRSCDLSG